VGFRSDQEHCLPHPRIGGDDSDIRGEEGDYSSGDSDENGGTPHNCGGISQVYSFKERSWSDSIGYFRGDNNMEFISVMRVWLKRK
jgi:hypothetical protein